MKLTETKVKSLDTSIITDLLTQVTNNNLFFEGDYCFLNGLNKSEIDHTLKSSFVVYFKVNGAVYDAIRRDREGFSRLVEYGRGLYGGEFGIAIGLTNLMHMSRRGIRPYCDLMQALSDSSDNWKKLLLSFPKAQTARFNVQLSPSPYPTFYCEASYLMFNECWMQKARVTPVRHDIGYVSDISSEYKEKDLALNYLAVVADAFEEIRETVRHPAELRPPFIASSFIISGNTLKLLMALSKFRGSPEFITQLRALIQSS